MAPQAAYLFKHALVQDAAYSTLLREPRRALHSHIVETLENEFPEIAESQPEILARHCIEAGLIEKATDLWGKAGLRSLERSAAIEATEQLRRALAQIASANGKKLPFCGRRRRLELWTSIVIGDNLREAAAAQLRLRSISGPVIIISKQHARCLLFGRYLRCYFELTSRKLHRDVHSSDWNEVI